MVTILQIRAVYLHSIYITTFLYYLYNDISITAINYRYHLYNVSRMTDHRAEQRLMASESLKNILNEENLSL